MLTKAQLKMRSSGIGGSDVSIILGLNPWRTPLQLWAEKVGKLEPQEENAAMEWGSRLESAVYQKFKHEHAKDYDCSYGGSTIRHPEHKTLLATPDAFINCRNNGSGVLEIKTSSQHPWDNVPTYYLLQGQHYCYVLNKSFYMFAVLFRGTEYREYGPFQFDREAYEKQVIPELEKFWKCVEDKNPALSPVTLNDLNLIVDVDKEKSVDADVDMITMITQYRSLTDQVASIEALIDPLRLKIARAMGDASRVVDGEGNTLVSQIQAKPTKVVNAKALKEQEPETFDKFSKTRAGYRAVRIY